VVPSVVVPTTSSPRALGVAELTEIADEIVGDSRVQSAARLDDALDLAIGEAEIDGPGGGVLVTGSIVTVGEARRLLARRRRLE
jgi:dihydrofolate synthase / folylpolyglutamate synthase